MWGKDDGDYDSPTSRDETPDEKKEAEEAQIKKEAIKKGRNGPNKKKAKEAHQIKNNIIKKGENKKRKKKMREK